MTDDRSPLPYAAALVLLMILGGLGALSLYDLVDGPGDRHEEALAPTPALPDSPGALIRFAADARYYLGQRYALRETFIETNSRIKLGLFGHVPYPQVMEGRDGFLFLTTEGATEIAQGAVPLSGGEAQAWQDHFTTSAEAARAAGLPYLLVIAPNKHSVYGDLLPSWLIRAEGPGRTDQVLARAQDSLALPPIDLRTTFAELRAGDPGAIYYHPTDTHWNELGATRALQAAFAAAGLDPVPADTFVPSQTHGGDLARMIGRQDQTLTQAPLIARDGWACATPDGAALEIVTIDPALPRRFGCDGQGTGTVVAFIDSFGVSALPYLAQQFGRVEVFWQDQLDFPEAAGLGADLVLQIRVERRFYTIDPAGLTP